MCSDESATISEVRAQLLWLARRCGCLTSDRCVRPVIALGLARYRYGATARSCPREHEWVGEGAEAVKTAARTATGQIKIAPTSVYNNVGVVPLHNSLLLRLTRPLGRHHSMASTIGALTRTALLPSHRSSAPHTDPLQSRAQLPGAQRHGVGAEISQPPTLLASLPLPHPPTQPH